MNIEFIKSEFEKLTLILHSWKEGQNISAIERDIVLDKLKNIYDAVRFADGAPAGEEPAATVIAAPQKHDAPYTQADNAKMPDTTAETAAGTEEEGDEVEVEFIFDGEHDTTVSDGGTDTGKAEEEPAIKEERMDTDDTRVIDIQETPAIPETPAATSRSDMAPVAAAETPAATAGAAISEPEADMAEEMTATPHAGSNATPATDTGTASDEPATTAAQRPMNSLFGSDEVKHRQPSRHHRMMSIYDYDTERKPEKVVDISKIFDNDDYAPDAKYDPDRDDTTDGYARRGSDTTPVGNGSAHGADANRAAEDGVTTIADAMAASKHTLADTLTRPAPLAEQITHSATTSLRDAIGINDKFLLIRDLFAGDEHEYEKAVSELDSFDNLDDCMIYIVENYAWNPNSEGAKFMMQLLERKLS